MKYFKYIYNNIKCFFKPKKNNNKTYKNTWIIGIKNLIN